MSVCFNKLVAVHVLALVFILAAPLGAKSQDRVSLTDLPELTRFIDQLRTMANHQEVSAIRERIAPDFFIARDFGGMYGKGMPGWWNFSTSYAFAALPANPDAPWVKKAKVSIKPTISDIDLAAQIGAARFTPHFREESWRLFLNELPRNFIQRDKLDGPHCGEAQPYSPLHWSAEDGPSMSGRTAYVLGDRVNLRLAPKLESPIIGQFETSTIINVISDQPTPDPRHRYYWLKVVDYSNPKMAGYMVASQLTFTHDKMICFQKATPFGPWRIVGVVLGGD